VLDLLAATKSTFWAEKTGPHRSAHQALPRKAGTIPGEAPYEGRKPKLQEPKRAFLANTA
jgi:hypothetical protein